MALDLNKYLLSATRNRYFKHASLAFALIVMPTFALGEDSENTLSHRMAYLTEFDPTTAFLMHSDIDEWSQMAFDISEFAAGYLGRPYCRGAKGPTSFDCSGFTSYVFRQFGISLGASSQAQYAQGSAIDLLDAQAGDLIFFSGSRPSKTQVGHVGIVVDMDDDGVITFIHASISDGVRYDNTTDPYYSARLIGARRMLK